MTTILEPRTGVKSANPVGVFDDPRYAKIALENASRYQNAAPYPHCALDNFLPEDLAYALAAAIPDPDDIAWVERDNKNNRRRFQTDETKLPTMIRSMLREMNSRQFTLFLETLTGIESLFPDPYFIGGGVHLSSTGDFLNIHADFNWHHKLQAYRRVNALLYLPERWEPEWQGALEFWDRDMTGPRRLLDRRAFQSRPTSAQPLPARRAAEGAKPLLLHDAPRRRRRG